MGSDPFWNQTEADRANNGDGTPSFFVDEQVRGAFKDFKHTHEFVPAKGGTRMIDTFVYTSPLGILGKIADKWFLEAYMYDF